MKLISLIAICLGTVLCSFRCPAENLRIAVASNFAPTLIEIIQRYKSETDQQVEVIQGSTGKFYAQIKQGAPFDIFMAADAVRPQLLEQESLIVPNSRFTYAFGQLVLWSAKSTDNSLDLLKSGKFNKLAIANPQIAPYGQAAIEVLKFLDIRQRIEPKLVFGENAAQTFQFVQTGSADLGFVPLSFVIRKFSNYWTPTAGSYHPLQQQLVILMSSREREKAKQFVGYLKRPDTKDFIKSRGYLTS